VQSGELETLKQQLRARLIESGWRDKLAEQVRGGGAQQDGGRLVGLTAFVPARLRSRVTHALLPFQCRHVVRQRGYENVTVDQLAHELMPQARASVPDRRARAQSRACARRGIIHTDPPPPRPQRSVKAELLKSIKESLHK
jgi:hypothetical protein